MIPVTEKMISTTKKDRMTNSCIHIYVNCLLAILVYVFNLFTFYKGHRIFSYLHSAKQKLSDHSFW